MVCRTFTLHFAPIQFPCMRCKIVPADLVQVLNFCGSWKLLETLYTAALSAERGGAKAKRYLQKKAGNAASNAKRRQSLWIA
eukprot:SAG31_NODE_571_length_13998_cov_4.346212_8_plen_82_part_00